MSEFQAKLDEARRLYLLRVLVEGRGSVNESILREACRAGFHAHGVTRQRIRDDLAWLEDRGCVTRTWLDGDTLLVAGITGRGEDVARGDITVEGIGTPPIAVG